MNRNVFIILVLVICNTAIAFCQVETTAFTEFKNQSSTNILPDFSFAGYQHGEKSGYSVDADPCNAHTDPSKMGLGSSS